MSRKVVARFALTVHARSCDMLYTVAVSEAERKQIWAGFYSSAIAGLVTMYENHDEDDLEDLDEIASDIATSGVESYEAEFTDKRRSGREDADDKPRRRRSRAA